MSRSFWRTLLALAAVAALLGISACGGDDNESSDSGTPAQSDEGSTASGDKSVTDQLFAGTAVDNMADPAQGKKGGKLTVLSGGDVDYMDPGKTYYTYAIGIMNAIHRGLYSYTPQDASKPVPDLAEGEPEISADGKTVTVKLKHGVMFSKPVSREVEAKDVKYALERAFTANVANGYARVYLGDIKGVAEEAGRLSGDPRHRDAGQVHDRPEPHEGHRRGRRGRPRDADLGPGPEGVRAEVRRGDPLDLRRGGRGLHRPLHGQVRRRRQGDRLRGRQDASTWSATRTTPRWTTSVPRTWTRSSSRPATRTPPSRRAAS